MKKFNFDAESFRVIFRAIFALICLIGGMWFLGEMVFNETARESELAGPIAGFIMGTMITLILTYYFGSSDGMATPPPIAKTNVTDDPAILPELKPRKEPNPPMGAGAGPNKEPTLTMGSETGPNKKDV